MKLASQSDRLHATGAELVAISVDDRVRQVGMFSRWPTPNVKYVSDSGGESYLKQLGLFDPNERGGIAVPALVVLDPNGVEVHRYAGDDFADRVADEGMFQAVEKLGLQPISPPVGGPIGEFSDEIRGYFRARSFSAYMSGSRTGALALSRRVTDPQAVAQLREHVEQMSQSLVAWKELRNS